MGTAVDVEQIAHITVGDGPKRISVAAYALTIVGNGLHITRSKNGGLSTETQATNASLTKPAR